MPSQIEKLRAYVHHLVDDVIHLREKYALLEPMIFDRELTGSWSRGKRARGFQTLRTALLFSCAQDVAKIAHDGDPRVPSLVNLILALEGEHVRNQLRDDFAVIKFPREEEDRHDPAVERALRRMEQRETEEGRQRFDALYSDMVAEWAELRNSHALKAFVTIRHKITAHTEVRYGKEEYTRVDVSDLGLKWEDIRRVIEQLQSLADKLNLLIRSANFLWDMLDEHLLEASKAFWGAAPQVSREPNPESA